MSIPDLVLVLVVTVAAVTDLRSGKIFNGLTYPACVFAWTTAAVHGGWSGLGTSLAGFAVGFLPFFVLYATGGLGGGDVKLMGAVGAFLGPSLALQAMVTSVLVGGLIAVLMVVWAGQSRAAARFLVTTVGKVVFPHLEPEGLEVRRTVPFGVAICLGTLLVLVAGWLGHGSPAELIFGA